MSLSLQVGTYIYQRITKIILVKLLIFENNNHTEHLQANNEQQTPKRKGQQTAGGAGLLAGQAAPLSLVYGRLSPDGRLAKMGYTSYLLTTPCMKRSRSYTHTQTKTLSLLIIPLDFSSCPLNLGLYDCAQDGEFCNSSQGRRLSVLVSHLHVFFFVSCP